MHLHKTPQSSIPDLAPEHLLTSPHWNSSQGLKANDQSDLDRRRLPKCSKCPQETLRSCSCLKYHVHGTSLSLGRRKDRLGLQSSFLLCSWGLVICVTVPCAVFLKRLRGKVVYAVCDMIHTCYLLFLGRAMTCGGEWKSIRSRPGGSRHIYSVRDDIAVQTGLSKKTDRRRCGC
jgi:hypothetical protein